jgi:hypothetical protein
LYRHGWDKVTYRELLQGPLGKLVSSQIALAVCERATRITWGLPPGGEFTKADEADVLAHHEETMRQVDAALQKSREELGDEPASSKEERADVRFRRRDGLPEMPVWKKVDGKWFRGLGIPVTIFAYLAQHLCERLVSLGKSRLEGGKEEWIEYASFAGEEDRRFARVDLVIEANNSITLDLLEIRVEQGDARVWWRHWKV